jgi:hypothetical protein
VHWSYDIVVLIGFCGMFVERSKTQIQLGSSVNTGNLEVVDAKV